MSDPNLKDEEDDLISQDDIDKLLDISSEDNDAGELSQDDIDSLLNESDPDAGEDDAGELSQDDIDRMMAGNALDEDAPPQDDDSELSQDDISQFMNDSQNSDSGDDGGDDELISLEDIQGVMSEHTQGNDATNSESEPDPIPEAETESNQDDVAEQTVGDATVDDAPVTEAPGQGEDPFDDPIDESQATDVADCMITQESMDALIEASIAAPDIPETEDGDTQEQNLSDPINRISTKDGSGADDAQENEDDVTQDDIDTLLQQSDEKDELLDEDEDILISQDDINTLLMATAQEDEDLLAILTEKTMRLI